MAESFKAHALGSQPHFSLFKFATTSLSDL